MRMRSRTPEKKSTLRSSLSAFSRDVSGNMAMIFALILAPMVLFMGGAIDLARWSDAKSKTQAAIDAALLAAARSLQTNGGDKSEAIRIAALTYKVGNASRLKLATDTISFKVGPDNTSIVATGKATIKSPLLGMFRISELTVAALSESEGSEVRLAPYNIEMSLMLDITGSMVGARLDDLKKAATDLVNIVIPDKQVSTQKARAAIVPYSAGVNPGSFATDVRGAVKSGTCTQPGCQAYKFTNALGSLQTLSVSNCVSERTGAHAFDDAPPSTAKLGWSYIGPSNTCPSVPALPLTSDKTALISTIDALQGAGSTAAQTGFAWAWYVLSPQWAGIWPASTPGAYGSKSVKKIAILMTDGEFNSPYCNGAIARDATTGSGSAMDHINCNAPNGSSYAQALALCSAMKSTGIEVYTIGFDVVDSSSARQVMTECASDASRAYNAADGTQLRAAFRDIAMKIANVYLAR